MNQRPHFTTKRIFKSAAAIMAAFTAVCQSSALDRPDQNPGNNGHFVDCAPIARWNATSLHAFSKPYEVGIVAYHGSGQEYGNTGIKKVEFYINEDLHSTVTKPSMNPRTNIWEFWTTLIPLEDDGKIEIAAIVYPNEGLSRVMQNGSSETLPSNNEGLILYSNKNQTYNERYTWVAESGSDTDGDGSQNNPFKTIDKAVNSSFDKDISFATVYLKPGTYEMAAETNSFDLSSETWLTIAGDPQSPRENIILTPNSNISKGYTPSHFIRLKDLTIAGNKSDPVIKSPSNKWEMNLYLEGVHVTSLEDRTTIKEIFNSNGLSSYAFTESERYRGTIEGLLTGPGAWHLIRNVDVIRCKGDVFSGSKLVTNCNVIKHSKEAGQHADLYQSYNAKGNRIIQNCHVISHSTQLIFLDSDKADNTNIAIVNNYLESEGGQEISHASGSRKHTLIWHNTMVNQRFRSVKIDGGVYEASGIYGNVLVTPKGNGFSDPSLLIQHNVIVDGDAIGENSIFAGRDNYESRLKNEEIPRILPWDMRGNVRMLLTNCGADSFSQSEQTPSSPSNLLTVN